MYDFVLTISSIKEYNIQNIFLLCLPLYVSSLNYVFLFLLTKSNIFQLKMKEASLVHHNKTITRS